MLGGRASAPSAPVFTTSTSRRFFRLAASDATATQVPRADGARRPFWARSLASYPRTRRRRSPRTARRFSRPSTRPLTTTCSARPSKPPSQRGSPVGRPPIAPASIEPGIVDPALGDLSWRPSARVTLVADARRERPGRVRAVPDGSPHTPRRRHRAGAPARARVPSCHVTSRAAFSRVRRAMDRERPTTHLATPVSSPATSPARMRRTSNLRPSDRRACPARHVTRCRAPPSSEACMGTGPWTSRSTPPWSRARRPTTLPPARAPCLATTRVARSLGSRGPHRRHPSGVATAMVRPHPATTLALATTMSTREANATGHRPHQPDRFISNGKVDLGNGSGLCGACHGSGDSPWPSTAAHAAHQNPTLAESLACSSCHVVPAAILDPGHLDGMVTVTFFEPRDHSAPAPLGWKPVHERRLP